MRIAQLIVAAALIILAGCCCHRHPDRPPCVQPAYCAPAYQSPIVIPPTPTNAG